MVLLQVQVQMPQHNATALIAVVAALVVAVIFFMVNSRRRAGSRSQRSPQKFTRARFRRAAYARGLNQVQARSLENLVRKYRPSAPMTVFSSAQALDIVLAKAITEVKQQSQRDSVREAHINTIYRIKQAIEHNAGRGQSIQSTSQIRIGQRISITTQNGLRYPTQITGKLRNVLAAEIPLDDARNEVRWQKWTPVEVFFSRAGGQGFAFQSKVVGYSRVKGATSVLLQHSNSISAAAQRRYRRKSIDRPAYFYAIQIMTVGGGRNAKRQAVAQTRGALGTVLDVSAGGCAVKSTFPLPKGALIKIEFETDRQRAVTVYGKVKNVRKAEPMGGVMHVMFTQISRKNLNSINSYVYNIG